MPRAPLLTLLLVASAAADWVEISQQHYQKPIKLHTTIHEDPNRNIYAQDVPLKTPRNPYLDIKPALEDVIINPKNPFLNQNVAHTPTRESFLNHSISEHGWHQDTRRLGNRRDPGAREPTHKLTVDTNVYERKKTEIETERGTDLMVIDKDESFLGKIERVPNVGSVKRVKLSNTPVKSPALNTSIFDRNPNRRVDAFKHSSSNDDSFSDELDIKTDIFKKSEENISLKPSSHFKYVFTTEKSPIAHGKVYFSESTKLTTPFHRFTSKLDIDFDRVKHSRGDTKYKQDNTPEITEGTNRDEGTKSIATSLRPVKYQESLNNENLPKLVHKKEKIIIPKNEIPVKETTENNPEVGNIISNNKLNRHLVKEHKENENKPSQSEKNEKINTSSSEIKVNTIENMLKFMKVVADTISKNTRMGPNGKIAYLNELKNTLLTNIKERIEATWPEDREGAPPPARRSRSAPGAGAGSARGHVEFPSSESALMTISFLTFAVFLIKLVLQVIQTYKHKTMVMAPLMVATAGRAIGHQLRASN